MCAEFLENIKSVDIVIDYIHMNNRGIFGEKFNKKDSTWHDATSDQNRSVFSSR